MNKIPSRTDIPSGLTWRRVALAVALALVGLLAIGFWVIGAQGTVPMPAELGLRSTPTYGEFPCDLCPDSVVFHSDRDGGDYDIYRMDFDGENVIRLTASGADDIQPTWRTDNWQIAFASNRDGDWEIYRMNRNGHGQTNVTKRPLAEDGVGPSQDMAPSWICKWIAFQTDRHGNWEIYKTDPEGNQQIRLTNNEFSDQQPVW